MRDNSTEPVVTKGRSQRTVTAKTAISALHWSMLLDRLEAKECVPFLGAGVNATTSAYEGLPLGRDLVLRLLRELTGCSELAFDDIAQVTFHDSVATLTDLHRLALQDLPRVALHLGLSVDRDHMLQLLMREIPDDQRTPSALLQVIAGLPLKLVITTNYDRLLERAFGARPHIVEVQQITFPRDERAARALEGRLIDADGVVIYKIHGSFPSAPGAPASRLVITEDDYIQFLTVVGREIGGIPTVVKSRIQRNTLLFLGYSLEDWDFRTLFKGIVETLDPDDQRKSIAIQLNPSDFWVDYWEAKGVIIYNVDLGEFAEELESRFADRVGRPSA